MRKTFNHEKIVVTFTTWSQRISNVPIVLDSIFNQSIVPDYVVLNLASEEIIPNEISLYLEAHNVIINKVYDSKVYKKLFPTLSLFPNALVINIDDDFIYPPNMIQDFINAHRKHPNSPISGNRCSQKNIKCHCGCASLTKKSFFGNYFDYLDSDLIEHCPSDDLVYSYLIQLNGKRYHHTKEEYFINMKPVNPVMPYSNFNDHAIDNTWDYLVDRFGPIKGLNGFIIFIHKLINKLLNK